MAFRIGRKHAQHTYPEPNRGSQALSLAHGWADNPTDVAIGVGNTTVASVPVTPKVTGKFRVTATFTPTNTDTGVPHNIVPLLRHAGAPPVTDYTPGTPTRLEVAAAGNEAIATGAFTFEYTVAFPVGQPVTLLLTLSDAASPGVTVFAHSAQLLVEEVGN